MEDIPHRAQADDENALRLHQSSLGLAVEDVLQEACAENQIFVFQLQPRRWSCVAVAKQDGLHALQSSDDSRAGIGRQNGVRRIEEDDGQRTQFGSQRLEALDMQRQ